MSALTDLADGVKEVAYLFDHVGSSISSYTNIPSNAWPAFGRTAHSAYEAARQSMGEAVGNKSAPKGIGGVAHDIVQRLIAVIANYGAAENAAGVAAFDVDKTLQASKSGGYVLDLIDDVERASSLGAHDGSDWTTAATAVNAAKGLWRNGRLLNQAISTSKSMGSPVLEALRVLTSRSVWLRPSVTPRCWNPSACRAGFSCGPGSGSGWMWRSQPSTRRWWCPTRPIRSHSWSSRSGGTKWHRPQIRPAR